MWLRERVKLTAVARGAAKADRYVRGGLLLNVYTGEIHPAQVAISGERIAYVGVRDDMVGPRTEIVDAAGRTLVPGYIEPHAHPWNLASPAALARHVLPLGTTSIFGDTLTVYELGGLRGFETAVAALARGPLKFYWLIRPHGQSRIGDHTAGASAEKVAGLAAAGITSDHEPITGQEALDRARQGIALMLRQSS